MSIELRAALHAWWRFAWRSWLASLVIFPAPYILLFFAVATRSGAGALVSGFLLIASVVTYLFVAARIMARSVFGKPVRGTHFAVFRDGRESLSTPFQGNVAWGLLWGVMWRTFGLGAGVQGLVAMLRPVGFPPAALGLIAIALGVASQIVAFWLIIVKAYGRTRISVVTHPSVSSSPPLVA